MAPSFYNRLKFYYQSIGKTLLAQAENASIFPNSTDKGVSREMAYVNFLENHLPSACNVALGGFLFDLNGKESDQIDIIITCSTCPRYKLPIDGSNKEFACVEGTLGAISIKSNLDSKELFDSLEKFEGIPLTSSLDGRKSLIINIPQYEDWPYKIIYGHKGVSLETLCRSLHKYYVDHPHIPYYRRPNLIHVNGSGCIIRILPGGGKLRNGQAVPEHTFHLIPDATNVVALMETVKNIQQHASAANHILFNYGTMIDMINFD